MRPWSVLLFVIIGLALLTLAVVKQNGPVLLPATPAARQLREPPNPAPSPACRNTEAVVS